MRPPSYSPRVAAQLLNVPPHLLHDTLRRDEYSADELWALRSKLARYPSSLQNRKQLFLNLKGGTGKTSLSTSYAYRLAEMGYSVLLVDLDSQGHATQCLGYDGANFRRTMHDVLVGRLPMEAVIQRTPIPNLSFVPSNLSMSGIDLALMPLAGREFRLRNALNRIEQQFDVIVLDAAPSFGLLNLNAMLASQDVLVPVLADFLSFHGLTLLFQTVESLQQDLDLPVENIFVVVNAFNSNYKLAKEALDALKLHYGPYLLHSIVRQCTRFAQAASEGAPVFAVDRECKAAEDIQAVIHEVLLRLTSVPKLKRAS